MRATFAVAFSLLFSSVAGVPQSPAGIFAEANKLYQNGDFSGAELLYKRLVEARIDSGALYYNLGNACFKQKRLGEAIYYWEKAQRKLPGDRDVKENLELAGLLVVDRIEIPPDPLLVRLIDMGAHFLTIDQESWAILTLFVCANVMLGLYLMAPGRRSASWGPAGSIAAAFLLLIFCCSLGWKLYEQHWRHEGIIVEQKADIRSGPGPENVTVFTVHEGIKVRIRGELAGWYQVSLPNGWTGWLEKDSLRIL
jgi:tetratricopeptide (TPR) repeat protein